MPRATVTHTTNRRLASCLLLILAAPMAALPSMAEIGVPFKLVRDRLIIETLIHGAGPYPLQIDVSQPRSVIAADVAEALGLAQASSALVYDDQGRGTVLDIVQPQAVAVGDAAIRPFPLAVMDLAPALQLGAPVAGIVSGRDLAASLTLDFAANELILCDSPDSPPFEKDGPGVSALAIQDDGRLTAGVLINGRHHLPLELDTTFPGMLALPEDLVRDYGLMGPMTRRLEAIAALPGLLSGETQFRLDSVKLGAAVVRRPVCSVLHTGEPARLGVGFMKQCRLTIDYGRSLVRVEAPGGAVTDPPVVGCGLAPAQCVNGAWSIWVARHSPADRAGIVPGSTLLYVGEHEAGGVPAEQIMAWLSIPEGENLHVVLEHEGHRTEMTLVAERLL